MSATETIAKILRTDKHQLVALESRLAAVTGKKGVLDKIVEENDALIKDRLLTLGVSREAYAKEVYDALISKIESDDNYLFSSLGRPDFRDPEGCQKVADIALEAAGGPKGFFLKVEKAKEFLLKQPPRRVMDFLGYDSAEKMLEKEDLLEVMSALRFIEGNDWLNNVFFKQYETLSPGDFEERPVRVLALSKKWGAESQKFILKKHHNISHLKELGIVFVIPVLLGISGEVLRMFALILHYLNEIPFYSRIFKNVADNEITFAQNIISLLRGDVAERAFVQGEKSTWLVVQRYLAKDDENDWRLFVPHVNPEVLHWLKAEETLESVGAKLDNFAKELGFWKNSGWVGDYFKDETGVPILVSFDLVDTVMDLVKEKELTKYIYHHQEALWNKIFTEYFGRDQLEKFSGQYLLQGYFEI